MTPPEYITADLQTPFEWGVHDCVCFAVGWLEIATGRDYLSEHRPWSTDKQAARLLKKLGGLEMLFDQHLARVPPAFARDGDITLVGNTAFLFSGTHIVGPGKSGLIFKSRMEAACAWAF